MMNPSSNMQFFQLEKNLKPYTLFPNQRGRATPCISNVDDILYGKCRFNPFISDKVCIPTVIRDEIAKRRFLQNLRRRYLRLKAIGQMSEPHTFENYIPPPPPLFEGDEILLCEETEEAEK